MCMSVKEDQFAYTGRSKAPSPSPPLMNVTHIHSLDIVQKDSLSERKTKYGLRQISS